MSELKTEGFTRLHVEASLCIWEDMLACYAQKGRVDSSNPMPADKYAVFSSAWENHGTVEMRHAALDLGEAACAAWDTIPEGDMELIVPYDWEFIPWFVDQIEWNEGIALDPDGWKRPFRVPDDINQRLADELIVRRGRNAVLGGLSAR